MSKNAAIVKTKKIRFFIILPFSKGRGRMHEKVQFAHDPPTILIRDN